MLVFCEFCEFRFYKNLKMSGCMLNILTWCYEGAFLDYKIFVHNFFLAMCTCAQNFLGRVHMCIRADNCKNSVDSAIESARYF